MNVKADNILAIKLNEWRHQIAKFDDESPEFVLPKNLLIYIS
jgi:ribonuclease D